ncbi:MAG: CRISPR-associated protein Csc1 [Methanothermococcus sp.]|jgi:CRISPR-associated protein Csc1|uniref:type I-D CRISPR-associated protein Cas5/Csc1 n=1 Tax=Methanothermococcus sp. TaxID=2614238 RepID=UPI002583B43C|nr:type I-D CRISPR-associated protein Cas5/Csc1 [Methanothermococcus sp.]MDK2790242.1 CRISPR-associated protein Csc1 [Methanothermococcus sp.]MDK2978637.1 CRISPR-associated protein Csc1 [Bacteroidales bacterium]MDK2987656.1 CRISPR-associated protein Csc1 [Methanothermococcus sp.]
MLRHYKITLLSPLFSYNKTEGGVASTEPFIGDIALDYALNFVLAKKKEYTYQIKDKPNYEEIKEFGFLWTIGRPINYEKTPVYARKTSEIADYMVRKNVIEQMGKGLFKNYFHIQGIKEGSTFEASLLTFDNVKLPERFTLRVGTGRECLLLFEEKGDISNEIWLNLYTIKKIFGKEIRFRENHSIRYILSNYIIAKSFNVTDIQEIFNL